MLQVGFSSVAEEMPNLSNVTEPNVYVDPGAPLWTKISLTVPWIVGLIGGCTLLAIAKYERDGKMGHYRPLMNQITSYANFTVS